MRLNLSIKSHNCCFVNIGIAYYHENKLCRDRFAGCWLKLLPEQAEKDIITKPEKSSLHLTYSNEYKADKKPTDRS